MRVTPVHEIKADRPGATVARLSQLRRETKPPIDASRKTVMLWRSRSRTRVVTVNEIVVRVRKVTGSMATTFGVGAGHFTGHDRAG
jgi:hypothetical protein